MQIKCLIPVKAQWELMLVCSWTMHGKDHDAILLVALNLGLGELVYRPAEPGCCGGCSDPHQCLKHRRSGITFSPSTPLYPAQLLAWCFACNTHWVTRSRGKTVPMSSWPRNHGVLSPAFCTFQPLSFKSKGFCLQRLCALAYFFLALFLGVALLRVLWIRWQSLWLSLPPILRSMEINKSKKKRKSAPTWVRLVLPIQRLLLTPCLNNPRNRIHPHSSSLNSRTNICLDVEQSQRPFFFVFFFKIKCTSLVLFWTWFSKKKWNSQDICSGVLGRAVQKEMKGFKCFLICFFLLEAQAFEIPTDELSEVSISKGWLAAILCSANTLFW